MKCLWAAVLALVCLVSAAAAQETTEKNESDQPELSERQQTILDKVSYGFGRNIAGQLDAGGFALNPKMVIKGLQDASDGKDAAYSDAELEAAFKQLNKMIVDKRAQDRINANPQLKAQAEKNKKDGEAFLAANKEKAGVVTLKSGLQYKILKKGEGASPKETSTVRTHYHGTLINGTVFDSSVDRGEPAEFPVNGVIDGWTEALQLMKVGSKWRLYLPSDLAYGLSGSGQKIGPNTVLIFDVELLDIVQ